MIGPTGQSRIIQIHPTRRCNLKCLHCYSSSSPNVSEELPPKLLSELIKNAKENNYNVIGVSGGEPLIYKHLQLLLAQAHDYGLATTVTTNGMLLDKRRITMLKGNVDLLAVSLDGIPESHNLIRGNPKAFEKMELGINRLRDSGIRFGFIFTLTQYNLHELPWVTEFAIQKGAQLLQIHPLEEVGRAHKKLVGHRPDEDECNYAFLTAVQLDKKYGDQIRIQLDLVSQKLLVKDPKRFFVRNQDMEVSGLPLADLISPLIIESDGTVVPFQYGFNRKYALGNLYESTLTLLGEQWKLKKQDEFWDFCQQVYQEITQTPKVALSNWFDVARVVSEKPA